jgi:hypothetical protein
VILGLSAMAVANAATLLAAHAVVRKLRMGLGSVDVVLFLLVRILLISVAVLGAGLARVLHPLSLGLLGATTLALLVWGGAHRHLPSLRPFPWGRGWTIVGGLLLARLLMQVWIFAPAFDDVLSYHLPKVAEWVRAAAIPAPLGSDPRAAFPAGFELIETWWVVFLHHDALVEMAGVEFLLLAGASMHALATGLGWSARTAGIAALLFILGPGLYFQATSCLNDGAVAALLAAALALIAAGAPLPLLLLPLFLGAGVKPTALLALPGILLTAALIPRAGSRTEGSKGIALGLAFAALLTGISWYVRNAVVFGNPVYPMGPGGISSGLTGTTLQQAGPSLRSLQENLTAFVDLRIYDALAAPDGNCTLGFNGGAAAFALGFPALIVLLRDEPLFRRVALGVAVSTVCILACVVLDSWNSRFILLLTALPSLALARLCERSRPIAALAVLALGLQTVSTFVPGNLSHGRLGALARQPWAERALLPPPPTLDDGPIGFCSDDFGPAYPLYRPDFSRRVVYLREMGADGLLTRLDRDGVKRIVVFGPLLKSGPMFDEATRRGRLRPFEAGPWKGYDVVPEGSR